MSDTEAVDSPFTELYKNCGRSVSALQAERRKRLLEKQRECRNLAIDGNRVGLLEAIESQPEPGTQPKRRSKSWINKLYRDKLQLSEWMHERPEDLDNWMMVPCPVGRRCLLVIRKQVAVAYDKRGRSIVTIRTQLNDRQRLIVLDCVLTEQRRLYVLDMLVHNNLDLVQCEYSFRLNWLRSKAEDDALCERFRNQNQKDSFTLHLLPSYDFAIPGSVERCLQTYPQFPEDTPRLDGFLFYQKESHYVYGRSPLVTWLFPFMVTDVLQLPLGAVHGEFLTAKPATYHGDYGAYMKQFDEQRKLIRRKRGKPMVTDSETPSAAGWEVMEASNQDDDDNGQLTEMQKMQQLEMEG